MTTSTRTGNASVGQEIAIIVNDVVYDGYLSEYEFTDNLNQIPYCKAKFLAIDSTEQTDITINSTIKIVAGGKLVMPVYNISSSQMATNYENQIDGIGLNENYLQDIMTETTTAGVGKAASDSDSQAGRPKYSDKQVDEIMAAQLDNVSNVSPASTNTTKVITIRGENDSVLSFFAGCANVADVDWYSTYGGDTNTYPWDSGYFHAETKGSDKSGSITMAISGDDANITLSQRKSNWDAFGNYIKLFGRGDGNNQLEAHAFHATSVRTYLSADITATAVTIGVNDASDFSAPGNVWIGSEKISYTGIAANNLTGCTRGVAFLGAVIEAYAHTVNSPVCDAQYTVDVPQVAGDGSSINTHDVVYVSITDRTIIDQSALDIIAERLLIEKKGTTTDYNPPEFISFDASDQYIAIQQIDVGDTITITDSESGLSGAYRVYGKKLIYNNGDFKLTFDVSNVHTDIISEIKKSVDSTGNLAKYMQGATNIFAINETENAQPAIPESNYVIVCDDTNDLVRGYTTSGAEIFSFDFPTGEAWFVAGLAYKTDKILYMTGDSGRIYSCNVYNGGNLVTEFDDYDNEIFHDCCWNGSNLAVLASGGIAKNYISVRKTTDFSEDSAVAVPTQALEASQTIFNIDGLTWDGANYMFSDTDFNAVWKRLSATQHLPDGVKSTILANSGPFNGCTYNTVDSKIWGTVGTYLTECNAAFPSNVSNDFQPFNASYLGQDVCDDGTNLWTVSYNSGASNNQLLKHNVGDVTVLDATYNFAEGTYGKLVGLAYDGSDLWMLSIKGTNGTWYQIDPTDGSVTSTNTITSTDNGADWGSATWDGSNLFASSTNLASNRVRKIYKFNATPTTITGTYDLGYYPTVISTTDHATGNSLCHDGSNFFFMKYYNAVAARTYRLANSGDDGMITGYGLPVGLGYDSTNDRIWISRGDTHIVCSVDEDTGVEVDTFTPSTSKLYGMDYLNDLTYTGQEAGYVDLMFEIPEDAIAINKVKLAYRNSAPRIWSSVTGPGSSHTHTENDAGAQTDAENRHRHDLNYTIDEETYTTTDMRIWTSDDTSGTPSWTERTTAIETTLGRALASSNESSETNVDLTDFFSDTGWKGVRMQVNGNSRHKAQVQVKCFVESK